MDGEDDGDADGEVDLAEGGVREGSGGVGESGMTMAEDDGVVGGRGIIDDVGEGGADGVLCEEAGDGIIDGVGGCRIGKAEDDYGEDGGADGKAGGVEGLMCGADGIEFVGVGA